MKLQTRFWNLLVIFALAASALALPAQSAAALSTNIVISQVYGGGGNTGATYKNDFIELYNLGSAPVDITGWSVQYGSATGTGSWQVTNLSGTILPGRYYLVQEAVGSGGTVDLPTPDAIGTIAMAGANGKVALVSNTTALNGVCPACPVDQVGYGSANCFEGAATPALTNTTAALRNGNGSIETDNNSLDFTVGAPNPRNSAYVPPNPAPSVVSTIPADGASGVALDASLSVTFSEAITGAGFLSLSCGDSGVHTVVLASTDSITFTADPAVNFTEGELCTATLDHTLITDSSAQNMAADYSWSFTTYLPDPAPTVVSTVPASNATGVAVGDPLSVTFSEAVTVAAGAVSISCAYSGMHTAAVSSADNIIYSIDPDVAFTESERCTVTLESTLITDSSAQQLAADYVWSFTTYYNPDAVTPIAVARAAGAGWVGTLQGNVTLLPGLLGTKSIAIQDATGGMYVYPASTFTLPPLALGDVVQVKGTIKNYNGLLEIDPVASVTWISTGTVPAPLVVATGSVAPTQGLLIQVQGTLHLPTTPPAPGTNYTFSVNDGSGVLTGYAYKLTNIDMRGFSEGQQIRIIGLSQAYNAPQIQPRTQADLIDLRAPLVLSTVPIADGTGVSPYAPLSATFNKPLNPATLTDASFTLTGPSGAVSGSVSYVAGTQTAVFTPAAPLAPQSAYTAQLTTAVTDSYGVPLASAYSWSFTTGAADSLPPAILTRLPAPAAVDVPVSSTVAVAFSEALGAGSLNLAHFVLSGPYGTVPAAFGYDPVTFTVTLTPQASLLYSTQYTMTVTGSTADVAGNALGADDVWTFTTIAEPEMQVYFGDLHNHTSYSDGSGTPAEALAAGKAAGFDFMAISDHSYAISDSEWADTLSAVNAATGTDFVGLRGFEYTQGAEGHINVWNSVRHATRTNVPGCAYCDYTPNLEAGTTVTGFYPWLVSPINTPLDSAGEVMQFNHPGWINFNDWFYHPEVSGIARLEEVGNGSGSSYVFSEAEFIRSLDYGWKLGATNNADTHSTYWGVNTDHRTGVLMPELTKTALLEALRQRRTFASEDKNFNLAMKANGAWMGSEIANTGSIAFDISGMDPDGELTSLVELVTDQGVTIASTVPNTAAFTWQPLVSHLTVGVHYFYVKVTQADGDKIVTSPVWTLGSEDIAITDLTIQPTIPTTNNPSLLSVRVTNRVAESRTVTVGIEVNGVPLGAGVAVTVPANGDGYALFNWQPTVTGDTLIRAQFTDAPAGDNPDDNSLALNLTVTDELLPLILIDGGHGNLNTAANEMKAFIDDLSAHHYNVLKNLDALTASDLNPAVVKLLIITAPQYAYTADEQTAIANYVAAGGSLWMGGLADYTGKVAWASTVADRENAILDTIASVTGQTVNMRMNDDEVIDANSNNGYVFGVIWGDFPSAGTTGIGVNVEQVSTWSLNSIVDGNKQALTAEDAGVHIIMQGDLDAGYGAAPWYDPNHTSNEDADGQNDAFIYNPTWVYPATQPADAVPVPAAAAVELANGAGRIMLYGDSNDPFTIFAYTAGDGKQNELFNLQSVMWLLGDQLQKSTVAEARAQAVDDVPDNLNKLVWVEGEITAAYGEFFNVLYVQDETGGITVHAPAGDIDPAAFTRGTHVRVVGTVDIYNGDTEIQFFEAEMVQVIAPSTGEPVPTVFTTLQASLEANEGWLARVSGRVTGKVGSDTLFVDDGSGPVRVFLDGYNGNFADIRVNDTVQVTGLASEDGDGQRIRVRNHNFHTGIPDDVIVTGHTPLIYLPIIGRGN